MIDRNTDTRIVGPSSGSVTWRKRCHAVAPSIEGRLAELLGDLLEAGEQEDHVEAEVLPGDHEEQAVEDDVGVGEPLVDQTLGADRREALVEQPVGPQDLAPDDAGDDLGQDVGGEEQRAQQGPTRAA